MQIIKDKVVLFDYTVKNQDGMLIDTSEDGEPLAYLHGHMNIIPGLESAMNDHSAGDKFDVTIEPSDAYGEHNPEMIKVVPIAAFQGVDKVEAGMQFNAESPNGPQLITVAKVEGDQVTVDGNHPLAGQTLTFNVEVKEVRDASAEELEHGHVHGAGGHQH